MDIRLIAFDLDGTLLNSQKRVSKRNRSALEKAASLGIELVPATGRIFSGMPDEVRSLPFRYAICANGGQVFDSQEKCILHSAEISSRDVGGIISYMNVLPGACGYYWNDRAYMSSGHYDQLDTCSADDPILLNSLRRLYTPIRELPQCILQEEISLQKLQIYLRNPGEKQQLIQEMRMRFPQFAISSSLPNNIEVNSALATKGHALAFLLEHLGRHPENCMAFGDGTNDISMIQAAGIGVAMDNGDAEVKSVAKWIAPSNEEDGLACVIEELLT